MAARSGKRRGLLRVLEGRQELGLSAVKRDALFVIKIDFQHESALSGLLFRKRTMYSKLSHTTMSSHSHGGIATDPCLPVGASEECVEGRPAEGKKVLELQENEPVENIARWPISARGPVRPARRRVLAVAARAGSAGMSKRKGGSHLENALAKFQYVLCDRSNDTPMGLGGSDPPCFPIIYACCLRPLPGNTKP